jgi:hypothetical protein
VYGLKKSYFFFFAAFFAGFFAAFFLVAIVFYSPFFFSITDGALRPNIIAICSLYRVNEINSQEKNARAVAHFDDAKTRLRRRMSSMMVDRYLTFVAVVLGHARDPHGYWRFATSKISYRECADAHDHSRMKTVCDSVSYRT